MRASLLDKLENIWKTAIKLPFSVFLAVKLPGNIAAVSQRQ